MNALILIAGLLISKAADPRPSVDDLRGRYLIVEEWVLAAGSVYRRQAPPNGPLPEVEYQRGELEMERSKDLLARLKWKQKVRSDSLLELDLDDGFAGGRLLAWRIPEGVMVERLTYGSGVPVASGQRLKLVLSKPAR